MNERMKLLAEQCGFRANPDVYDRYQSFDIPRFAELIVKECANYAFSDDREHVAMLKHFGVTE